MKKINSFVNKYPLSKTLRFSLIPIGKTEENFTNAQLLEKDKDRAEKYERVKKYIDRYHKYFINEKLSELRLDGISEYAELYFKHDKTDKDLKNMVSAEEKLRKSIANAFSKDIRFNSLFKKEMIEEILPVFLTSQDEKDDIETFYGFATYFTGFHENRKNMYSAEAQTTAISYRCINENLPKFLDNVKKFEIVKDILPAAEMDELNDMVYNSIGFYINDIFCTDYYNCVLSQTDIDKYNNVIGGYFDESGKHFKGLNVYINLYNQQVAGKDKSARLPLFTELYKQILSDREAISFIPEKFACDNEVISSVNDFYNNILVDCLKDIEELFKDIGSYNSDGIFVAKNAQKEVSNAVFGHWDAIGNGWRAEYRELVPMKAKQALEKYEENMKKALDKKQSFSLAEAQRYGEVCNEEGCIGNVEQYLQNTVAEKISAIKTNYNAAKSLLTSDYETAGKLIKDKESIDLLKKLLDSIKEAEHILKLLKGTGKEVNKDFAFYGEYTECYETLAQVDGLYDKVRNYITQKPYSTDKIKLNFENSQHLGGWDKNKERDYRTVILRKNDLYYLAIMNKNNNKSFIDPPVCEKGEGWEKMDYKLLPGPNKMLPKVFFATSNIDTFAPSSEILAIRKNETFKKGAKFSLEDCHKFIDFFKESINKHSDWSQFGFKFSPTESYNDISEFYNEVKQQGYKVSFCNIPDDYIDELVEKGELYLFQIYNKDFSPKSHGKANLHTMYFKMLFDERNLADVVYQLNGGAEMFYREPSIKEGEWVVHCANEPLDSKNLKNPKRQSVFNYDIIKDKRYTKRQFSLHLPIKVNFKADERAHINNEVREALKNSEKNYVIGIDRGERNLLYVCVIDENGKIVEQKSLNEIVSDNNYTVDYHLLLDKKEDDRDKARKNWGTIESIKELKEGYLSQVIHQICEYVVKYDAIIAMEELNFGFKRGRFKVEKQVYQKFENNLSQKLGYLVRKEEEPEQPGGLLKAYQLTNKPDGVNKARQNGIIFYVPAWLTSKIDPVTGFVDLLKPRYENLRATLEFIEKIDDIRFNQAENIFEFDIDYSKFPKTSLSYRKQWTICTNGERIINERNKEKNDMWDSRTIVLTDEFKELFAKYNVDLTKDIKESILQITDVEFHKRFMKLLSYTLQMRNSITNDVNTDYLISPVKDENGVFYVSGKDKTLPENADANGAYNIARKALWAINVLKNTEDELLSKADLSIKNAEWLEYAQK